LKPQLDAIGRRLGVLGALDRELSGVKEGQKVSERDRFLGLYAFDGSMLFTKKQVQFKPGQNELKVTRSYHYFF
jgi:hypothetical protein